MKNKTFNHEGHYKCECGKEFTNSQSFNAHKSRCLQHYISIGKEQEYYDSLEKRQQASNEGYKKYIHEQHKQLKCKENERNAMWISEKHTCERCGKIMLEKYGSGRFCCRSCANARKHSDETKKKISYSLLSYKNPQLSNDELLDKQQQLQSEVHVPRLKYNGPQLPVIEHNLNKGYNTRDKLPYSEQFWKKVFDDNNVSYKMNVQVWKPGNNDYWLDFLIGDVDVEIDGEFHLSPERIKHDAQRTEWLESLGYRVYRIKWVNPTSNNKKFIVNNQIQDLFDYLNIKRIK